MNLDHDAENEVLDPETLAVLRGLGRLPDVDPPADLTDRILDRVRNEARYPKPVVRALPFRKLAPLAAAVVLVAVAIPVLLSLKQEQPHQLAQTTRPAPPSASQETSGTGQPVQSPETATVRKPLVLHAETTVAVVSEETVDAVFDTWQAESANASKTAEADALDLLAYGQPATGPADGGDPLSALVGF